MSNNILHGYFFNLNLNSVCRNFVNWSWIRLVCTIWIFWQQFFKINVWPQTFFQISRNMFNGEQNKKKLMALFYLFCCNLCQISIWLALDDWFSKLETRIEMCYVLLEWNFAALKLSKEKRHFCALPVNNLKTVELRREFER